MFREVKKRKLNQAMIADQLQARRITAPSVLKAFQAIDRLLFVPPEYALEAYCDCPLPIGYGQTISQPYIVALTLQELDPQPGQRVLDVGVGSGYQTALLSCMCGEVFGVERIEQLARVATETIDKLEISNVHIQVGDGSLGWPEHAPFDRIVCGAAAPDVPKAWLEQLADGGRIVMPLGNRDTQTLIRMDKIGSKLTRREICGVRFVPLIGEQGWH